MNTSKKSKTSLLLMEIIITIGIFMVCGSLCIRFFVNAHVMEKESTETNNALILAENIINVINAYDSPLEGLKTCFPTGNNVDENTFAIYYDAEFKECSGDYEYVMNAEIKDDENGCLNIDIIFKDSEQKEIYKLSTKKANNF